jgi:hypothetical protein
MKKKSSRAILTFILGDSNADFDFKIYAQSVTGEECHVSPLNRYCAFSAHHKDAGAGAGDVSESVVFRNLSVAKYKTTVEPAPAYSSSCPANEATKLHAQAVYSWNWESFKATTPITDLDFYFTQMFFEGDQIADHYQTFGEKVQQIYYTIPVETRAQAAVPKKRLNIGGQLEK